MMRLLRLPQVQKELNLSDEQKEKIREAQRQGGRSGFGPGAPTTTPPNPAQDEQKILTEILKPEQMQRLKEINLQAQGAAALKLPEVIKELAITDEQKEKIGELESQLNEQRRKIFQEIISGALPEERPEKMAEARREIDKLQKKSTQDALGVLTPEQREKFDKMTGKKIDLTPPPRRPGRGAQRPLDERLPATPGAQPPS
jgi:Spy/CpxP family protein refolding chaperone